MSFYPQKYHVPGTSPGTLSDADHGAPPVTLHVVDYNDKQFSEDSPNSVRECLDGSDPSTVTWIHVQGRPQPKLLGELGERYNVHPLALEDVQNTGQRPKVDEYGSLLFMILAIPSLRDGEAEVSQLSILLRDSVLITIYEGNHDPFEPVRSRLRTHQGRVRARGVDYLMYRVIDLAVDLSYPILDRFAERIEDLELIVLESPSEEKLQELHHTKRELLILRRFLAPQRDMLQIFLNEETDVLSEETRVFLRDCVDHMVHLMDLIEAHREHTTSILDSHLTNTNTRLNEVMRVLTVISTIFLPLNFLVGVYGMNFEHPDSPWAMPELHSRYGYPMVWGVIIAVVVTMLTIFRRRKWI
jgi:magnesium transporter